MDELFFSCTLPNGSLDGSLDGSVVIEETKMRVRRCIVVWRTKTQQSGWVDVGEVLVCELQDDQELPEIPTGGQLVFWYFLQRWTAVASFFADGYGWELEAVLQRAGEVCGIAENVQAIAPQVRAIAPSLGPYVSLVVCGACQVELVARTVHQAVPLIVKGAQDASNAWRSLYEVWIIIRQAHSVYGVTFSPRHEQQLTLTM